MSVTETLSSCRMEKPGFSTEITLSASTGLAGRMETQTCAPRHKQQPRSFSLETTAGPLMLASPA